VDFDVDLYKSSMLKRLQFYSHIDFQDSDLAFLFSGFKFSVKKDSLSCTIDPEVSNLFPFDTKGHFTKQITHQDFTKAVRLLLRCASCLFYSLTLAKLLVLKEGPFLQDITNLERVLDKGVCLKRLNEYLCIQEKAFILGSVWFHRHKPIKFNKSMLEVVAAIGKEIIDLQLSEAKHNQDQKYSFAKELQKEEQETDLDYTLFKNAPQPKETPASQDTDEE
jgi:hypothetical protein